MIAEDTEHVSPGKELQRENKDRNQEEERDEGKGKEDVLEHEASRVGDLDEDAIQTKDSERSKMQGNKNVKESEHKSAEKRAEADEDQLMASPHQEEPIQAEESTAQQIDPSAVQLLEEVAHEAALRTAGEAETGRLLRDTEQKAIV